MQSVHLRVRIVESGKVKADLTFPAAAVRNLPDLLPEYVAIKLKARGLDVHDIVDHAAAHNYSPGELFALTEGVKEVRVWLE